MIFNFRSIPLQVIVLPLSRIHLDELGRGEQGWDTKWLRGNKYVQITGIVHDIISIQIININS